MRKIRTVAIRLGFPTNNKRPVGDRQFATIEVVDEDSGLELLSIDLEPRQFFAMMAGGYAYAPAEMTEHPDKIGKVMIFKEIDLDKLGYQISSRDTSTSPVVAGAIAAAYNDGWQHVSYRVSHGGHFLRCQKWVDVDPDAHENEEN